MKTLTIFLFVALLGCAEKPPQSRLLGEFERATRAYYESDTAFAKEALLNFVRSVEGDLPAARASVDAQYPKLLDISWLRLASIYSFEGRDKDFQDAMAKAIYYFDKDELIANNPHYIKNKEEYLLRSLAEVEKERNPAWKRSKQ
jgi:hypothetical protein